MSMAAGIGQLKGRIRRRLGLINKFCGVVGSLQRRLHPLPEGHPLISFTFDDFPRSALTAGGEILMELGVRGTYYAASGLIDATGEGGPYFSREDVDLLLAQGHELGSHTHSHVSTRSLPADAFEADVVRGDSFVRGVTGEGGKPNFSYPFGEITLAAKARMGNLHASCRSTFYGVNSGRVDLNLLRANPLYSSRTEPGLIDELLRALGRSGGWLIFYTHDVCETPSPYGCTPSFLEETVKKALRSGGTVVTVAGALKEITGSQV